MAFHFFMAALKFYHLNIFFSNNKFLWCLHPITVFKIPGEIREKQCREIKFFKLKQFASKFLMHYINAFVLLTRDLKTFPWNRKSSVGEN